MDDRTRESDAIIEAISAHPDIVSLQAAIVDLNGTLRGKRLPIESLQKIINGQLRLPLSSANVDIWGEDIRDSRLVFETGDKDGLCEWTGRAQLPINWLQRETVLLPLWMTNENGSPFYGDSRRVLASVLDRYQTAKLTPVVATELEFYLTESDSAGGNRISPPTTPRSQRKLSTDSVYSLAELEEFDAFLDDVYATCRLQGIPVDAAIAENGAGQFEINFHHTDDVLKAADDTIFFKRLIKGIARKHGFVASFMAKPYADSAGNGMHVHASILDQNKNNIFADDSDRGSDALHSAVAGLLQTMEECTLIFAPHLNSYRRLSPKSHAPTQISWGYENRTSAIRIPGGDYQARRIEHRVSGSDANPYLVLAAVLAGALHGIEHNLTPKPAVSGDAYSENAPLPGNWNQAHEAFRTLLDNRGLLPNEFVELFTDCKQQEIDHFNTKITAFEIATYLETV